ncbi:NTP transferase domain-containing protein [Pendulispora rubella]|uniref:NTP transferase domain-containing protein n=1 Tax=Pendulispora rubella TaxID=2741070 RepID=A0ABZ2KZT8_9BACT
MSTAGAQAVILAGGLATRMRPFTLKTPKAMLDVAGRPFIDWQLEKLASCGYGDVILCIAHLGDAIRDHVGDGARFGLTVRYADEGPNLLGTLGAIRNALDLLAPAFLVTYGDSYLPFDYAAPLRVLEAHEDCDGVMSVYKNEGQWDASNVVTDGTWVARYQKGVSDPAFDHIDYGAIALRRTVVAATAPGARADLAVLQEELARQKRLRAYPAGVRFFEIGSPEGLATLTDHLQLKNTP